MASNRVNQSEQRPPMSTLSVLSHCSIYNTNVPSDDNDNKGTSHWHVCFIQWHKQMMHFRTYFAHALTTDIHAVQSTQSIAVTIIGFPIWGFCGELQPEAHLTGVGPGACRGPTPHSLPGRAPSFFTIYKTKHNKTYT